MHVQPRTQTTGIIGQVTRLIGIVILAVVSTTGLSPPLAGYADQGDISTGTTIYLLPVTRASCSADLARINAPTAPFRSRKPLSPSLARFHRHRTIPTSGWGTTRMNSTCTWQFSIATSSLQTLTQWNAVTLLPDTSGGTARSSDFVEALWGSCTASRVHNGTPSIVAVQRASRRPDSSDSDYHRGKYFVSSDTGDQNIAGRPRLDARWGEAR